MSEEENSVLNPETTDDERPLLRVSEDPDFEWVVVHTRPRCEKKFARFCEEFEMPYYCALQGRSKFYGNKKVTHYVPLFPGYAFCMVRSTRRYFVRQNQYVANVLVVDEQQKLVDQLLEIDRALTAGKNIEVMPMMETGKFVLVKRGPLKGMEGIVQRIKGRTRVIISVDVIRQSVSVEVDSSDVVLT
ncbi:MAG: transcription termination/antitermination NusG family protein [Verrucomicrobiota bacterium]